MTEKSFPPGKSARAAETLQQQRQRVMTICRNQAASNVTHQVSEWAPPRSDNTQVHQAELDAPSGELLRTQMALDASRMRYYDLYDHAPVGYLTVDEGGRILEINLTAVDWLGVVRHSLIKQVFAQLIAPADQDIYHLWLKHLLETRVPQMAELRILGGDKPSFWARLDGTIAAAECGATEIRIVLSDLSGRKQAEEEIGMLRADLRSRCAELAASNAELDSFSYSVAHDLRSPLRAVDGFSRIVLSDYGMQLDAQGQRMLGVIRSETQRMGRLIDDLLAFSRLGRQPIENKPIEMESLAQEVFSNLAALEPARNLLLDLHPLPVAYGAQAMITQVWEHLIGNAIKFTKERDCGVITIGARNGDDGVPIYYVQDNGAGFDMHYASKLFGMFERLHCPQEFPGAGSGLALVKRMVQRHDGHIWADAQVGQGATFSFTLHPSSCS